MPMADYIKAGIIRLLSRAPDGGYNLDRLFWLI